MKSPADLAGLKRLSGWSLSHSGVFQRIPGILRGHDDTKLAALPLNAFAVFFAIAVTFATFMPNVLAALLALFPIAFHRLGWGSRRVPAVVESGLAFNSAVTKLVTVEQDYLIFLSYEYAMCFSVLL